MLARALAGGVDVVLVEALDRLSRSQSDTARLFELLQFAGVRLETLGSGPVSELHVGLEGTMARLFLVELGKKTRRGLAARVQAGFSAGGRCFGYDLAAKGVLQVNQAEAETVRRIFTAYLGGASPRAIAKALNAEGVAGPRGRTWTAATINGDRRAGDGILHQELYVGVRVFNRRHFRKHPETGRRSSVLNPPDQWIRQPAPDLRILADDLWQGVQARKAALGPMQAGQARAPARLLSGLLRCGLCGGSMVMVSAGARARPGARRLACATRRDRGGCDNGAFPLVQDVEARVLAALRDRLLAPDAIARMVKTFHDDAEARHREAQAARAGVEREAAEIQRRISRAWDAFDDGILTKAAFGQRMAELEARREAAESALAAAAAPPPIVTLHPNAPALLRAAVEDLANSLDDDDSAEIRAALRPLIHSVTVTPAEGRGQVHLDLVAKTRALLKSTGPRVVRSVGAGTRSERNDDSEQVHLVA